MFEGSHAVALAAMLVLGGISQLVAPVAGYWSDRTTSSMGRRMPFILLGNVTLFISLGFMYLARTYMYGKLYMFLLLIAMISLNVAYTGFAGLVSDVVPAHQMGVTSGIMGGMTAAVSTRAAVCPFAATGILSILVALRTPRNQYPTLTYEVDVPVHIAVELNMWSQKELKWNNTRFSNLPTAESVLTRNFLLFLYAGRGRWPDQPWVPPPSRGRVSSLWPVCPPHNPHHLGVCQRRGS